MAPAGIVWAGLALQRWGAARDLASEGREIRCLITLFIPDDEGAFCLFDAGSVGTVEEACRRVALPFDRVLPVVQIDGSRGGEE
jgi:hypothetical protein